MEAVKDLKSKIKELELRIKDLQDNCEHDRIVYKYGANTGHLCESDDCYWVDYTCLDCDKKFHFWDDDADGYKMVNVGSVLKVTKSDYEVLKRHLNKGAE